jgi:hypothetical protein
MATLSTLMAALRSARWRLAGPALDCEVSALASSITTVVEVVHSVAMVESNGTRNVMMASLFAMAMAAASYAR